MDIEFLMAELNAQRKAVSIKKLAETTRISDCCEQVRKLVGISYHEAWGRSSENKTLPDMSYPVVGDFPFSIWCCEIDHHKAYGKSFFEAVERCLNDKGT